MALQQTTLAIGATLGSCILLACTTLFAKLMGSGPGGAGLHPLQITFARFLFAWVAIAAFAAAFPPRFTAVSWTNHIARTSLGYMSGLCLFAAATMIPLASATALSFLSPLVTMVCAIFFLSERVGPWRWSAAAVALAGAVILINPGAETIQIGALIAVAAAIFMGVEGVFLKRLADTEPPAQILLVNNSLGVVLALIAVSFVWTWPTAEGWALMAGIGFSMIAAQALLIQGMKRGDASLIVPLY
ncbi:MAG: DMT family transporter, partial [Pseudomonadota bacterium]